MTASALLVVSVTAAIPHMPALIRVDPSQPRRDSFLRLDESVKLILIGSFLRYCDKSGTEDGEVPFFIREAILEFWNRALYNHVYTLFEGG